MSKKLYFGQALRKKLSSVLKKDQIMVVFDTETTGLNAEKDQIIQISGIKLKIENETLKEIGQIDRYIRPNISVPEKIEELTGITNEFLADEETEADVFPVIKDFFKDVDIIAAYNTAFDERFTKALYQRNHSVFPVTNSIDILQMARELISKKDIKNHKLGTVINYFGLDDGIQFHSAIEDVKATLKLFQLFINEYHHQDTPQTHLQHVKVFHINRWDGFRGMVRWYIVTNLGSVYYDIRNKGWGEKTPGIIEKIDLDLLEQDVLNYFNISDLSKLATIHQATISMTEKPAIEEIQQWKNYQPNEVNVFLAKRDKKNIIIFYHKEGKKKTVS